MKHAPKSRRDFLRATGAAALTLGGRASHAQTAKLPNILFVIADDWGHNHAGAYGCTWVKTPAFDRIAREGVLFRNCFTSNPKCSPSRAAILTGRNSWQTKEAVIHFSIFPKDFPVYPALLEKAGYFVGLTGKGWGPGDYKTTGWDQNPAGHEFQEVTLKPPLAGMSNRDYSGNFKQFLDKKPADRPFCFWLGTHEPHRVYEVGAGVRAGKKLTDVTLPAYYPDAPAIRSDMLDYSLEVEWFDRHLGLAVKLLEERGELDNTFVVVTSDHGMPFPRVKGQIYEDGFHLPLAIRWGKNIPSGRVVDDFINARDFAPTFLALAGVQPPGTMTGRSILNVLQSSQSGTVDPSRSVMLIGKERHDLGRPGDAGYPVRAIRTREYLYIRNYEPDRWPAGNPETGYRNVDDGPTKQFLLSTFDEHYRASFGKRPAEELYLMKTDPECLKNVAEAQEYAQVKKELSGKMEQMLREEGDPRMTGNAAFFDTINYVGPKKHAYETWLRFNGSDAK